MGKNNNNTTALAVVAGVVAGLVAGSVVSLLFSPNSGKDNRAYVSKKAKKFAKDAKNKYGDIKNSTKETYDSVKGKVTDSINNRRKAKFSGLRDEIDDAIS